VWSTVCLVGMEVKHWVVYQSEGLGFKLQATSCLGYFCILHLKLVPDLTFCKSGEPFINLDYSYTKREPNESGLKRTKN
jgi:hypothetical protein